MDTGHEHSEQQMKQSRWGFRGMTVRTWLELLIVPLVLVGIGFLFEMQQDARQDALEQQQQALEDRRAKAERALAEERAQDEVLQGYLDQMGSLLLHEGLLNSELDSDVRMLARARTQTALQTLDPDRKFNVMQFLIETDLIQGMDGEAPIVSLAGAPLSDMVLRGASLSGADLRYADLSGADLRLANLSDADLNGTDLSDADLLFANLSDADLSEVVQGEVVRSGADLSGANLRYADLSGANLEGAEGVTDDQLAEAKFLEGATMPDGQKYEDWLKDRDKR
jgi:uncharacterized protein YjbI with pentapeptide repeats